MIPGDEMRRAAELLERRTLQVQALADTDRETASQIIREFMEQVVQTNIYPFGHYTPTTIVDWWRRQHATEPRRW